MLTSDLIPSNAGPDVVDVCQSRQVGVWTDWIALSFGRRREQGWSFVRLVHSGAGTWGPVLGKEDSFLDWTLGNRRLITDPRNHILEVTSGAVQERDGIF